MVATEPSLFQLTAADLMTPVAVSFREHTPLRQAAEELFRAGVHGAPVVDGLGECIGVFSVPNLALWAAHRAGPASTRPQSCSHQQTRREIHAKETTLCTMPARSCSFQAPTPLPGGQVVQVCREPHCVCAEWQVVEIEALPAEAVRNYMTSGPVTGVVSQFRRAGGLVQLWRWHQPGILKPDQGSLASAATEAGSPPLKQRSLRKQDGPHEVVAQPPLFGEREIERGRGKAVFGRPGCNFLHLDPQSGRVGRHARQGQPD
jgi:hypothetical protein